MQLEKKIPQFEPITIYYRVPAVQKPESKSQLAATQTPARRMPERPVASALLNYKPVTAAMAPSSRSATNISNSIGSTASVSSVVPKPKPSPPADSPTPQSLPEQDSLPVPGDAEPATAQPDAIAEKNAPVPQSKSIVKQGTAEIQSEATDSAPEMKATDDVPEKGAAESESQVSSEAKSVPTSKTAADEELRAEAESVAAAVEASISPQGGASRDPVELNDTAIQLTREARYDEAVLTLQQAIAAAPRNFRLYRNLSIVYESMKKFDKALTEARNSVELAPHESSALGQLCGLELITGNFALALRCYEKLRAVAPLDPLAQTLYGVALMNASRLPEAVSALQGAAAAGPPSAATMNALGVAYYNGKNYVDAAASFKSAVELRPDRSELRFNLALAQIALHNKEGALSQYKLLRSGNEKLAQRLYRLLFSDKVVHVDQLKTH